MGAVLSNLFVDVTALPAGFYGFSQLIYLMATYAFVLFNASNMISDGSELLLLIPSFAPIVGSVVLPVLGAVPDGAIVLFSGLGPGAQEQLVVGVGALAGSTIMLLTVPWALSVYAGRVNIVDGKGTYSAPKGIKKSAFSKLTPPNNKNLFTTGVEADDSVKRNSYIMMSTGLLYLVIQVPAFFYAGQSTQQLGASERTYALVGFIACTAAFVLYLIYMVKSSNVEQKVGEKIQEKRKDAIKNNLMNIRGLFHAQIVRLTEEVSFNTNQKNALTGLLGDDVGAKKNFSATIKPFFAKYDVNKDGRMDSDELKLVLKDLGMPNDTATVQKIMASHTEATATMSLVEFSDCMWKLCISMVGNPTRFEMTEASAGNGVMSEIDEESVFEDSDGEDSDEEEDSEIPEDLADMPPEIQQKRILMRAFKTMTIGTVLVLLFSDPMVSALSELGARTGIPAFYISFVLAPLASNASELIASYNYALKKTKKTIAISLVQLEGAACMNNTFCLGIFMALIYFVKLSWYFSAETISIIFVLFVMGLMGQKKIHRLIDALFVIMLYPLSLVVVVVLEQGFGLQ